MITTPSGETASGVKWGKSGEADLTAEAQASMPLFLYTTCVFILLTFYMMTDFDKKGSKESPRGPSKKRKVSQLVKDLNLALSSKQGVATSSEVSQSPPRIDA